MQAEQVYYSPKEYLELEEASDERHEYIDGQIILMPGGFPNHNRISGNLLAHLTFALKRQPYDVFGSDQRLWIPQKRICTYPDVTVVTGQLEFQEGRKDVITNPTLIAEVLSKSTESYDRSEKFAAYRTIPSFQEYILIDQYSIQVEQYVKTEANKWIYAVYETLDDLLSLASVPCEVSLIDLYDRVDFSDDEVG
jgi:Uma2 family endonuclease